MEQRLAFVIRVPIGRPAPLKPGIRHGERGQDGPPPARAANLAALDEPVGDVDGPAPVWRSALRWERRALHHAPEPPRAAIDAPRPVLGLGEIGRTGKSS